MIAAQIAAVITIVTITCGFTSTPPSHLYEYLDYCIIDWKKTQEKILNRFSFFEKYGILVYSGFKMLEQGKEL